MPKPRHTHDILPRGFGAVALALATGVSAFLLVLAPGRAESAAAPAVAPSTQTLPTPGMMIPAYPDSPKDFAFIHEGDYFHLFWIRHQWGVPNDSTERDFGHSVSTNLREWTQLDHVIPVRPDKWDNLHVWAPTILKRDGVFYMYYAGVTSVPYQWSWFQRIGLATSTDLLNWTRYDQPVFSGANVPWTTSDSSQFAGSQFRDPFVMEDPTTPGRLLMYYVTVPSSASTQLIVGVAQSNALPGFTDLAPLWCTDSAHYWGWCESPHVIEHNGLYYLFASTTSGHPIQFRVATSPVADSADWSGTYWLYDMAGQDPNSDHSFASETLSIPGHDYIAMVSGQYRIDVYEILWNATPPGFTLGSPAVPAAVTGPPPATGLALDLIPRAGSGPGVMFRASLPEAGPGRVDLFDVGGRRVRTLRAGSFPAGETVVAWDGRLDGGAGAPAGVYFAALSAAAGRRVARVSITN